MGLALKTEVKAFEVGDDSRVFKLMMASEAGDDIGFIG
jgi:hypothetical protein